MPPKRRMSSSSSSVLIDRIAPVRPAVLEAAEDPDAEQARLEAELGALCGAFPAAEQMKIDDIIEPAATRPRLIQALERALTHRTQAPMPATRWGILP